MKCSDAFRPQGQALEQIAESLENVEIQGGGEEREYRVRATAVRELKVLRETLLENQHPEEARYDVWLCHEL